MKWGAPVGALVATFIALVGDAPAAVPREVLALYDSTVEPEVTASLLRSRVELPLNHLGLIVRYHDIRQGLPAMSALDGVRGVVSWFHGSATDAPREYLDWCQRVIDSGRRFVVFADLGVLPGEGISIDDINAFWRRLGLSTDDNWVRMTYDLEILHRDPDMIGFERDLGGILPGYPVMRLLDGATRSFLTVGRPGAPESESVLVATGPGGGFVAPGYAVYAPDDETKQWFVNPFELLRHAFDTDDLPKPDTTTLSGRRIFYSHIDGDGWRNVSLIPSYAKTRTLSAEVVLEEILKPFASLPVSVAPVVGDLDLDWHGTPETLRIARQILALSHVEAGSHTYSHPLDWKYFDVSPEVSARRHARRRGRRTSLGPTGGGWLQAVSGWLGGAASADDSPEADWSGRDSVYDRPRSYQIEPFRLDKEIEGSVAFVQGLLPHGKKVEVVQWSGDTSPFAAALAAVRELGLRNINGGDSRFDVEYPSYAWVSPLGLRVGNELQIYASNSNENTYTDLWTSRFFGFQHLKTTIENTEHPIRVKPFNVYYHMYSGERLASLNAVLANLELAEQSELAPITTSGYAAVVSGFFTTKLEPIGDDAWRISHRDGIETIRFDHADTRSVDWERSRGVVGQRRFKGSLYVALDAAVVEPVVALIERELSTERIEPPYLIEGRWRVSSLEQGPTGFRCDVQGFGAGSMTWRVPVDGLYQITETRRGASRTAQVRSRDHTLTVSRERAAIQPVQLSITLREARETP